MFAEEYRLSHERILGASGESPEFFHEYKVRDVARVLGSSPARRLAILDFGCGIGNSLPFLRRQFSDCELTGIDVSPRSLEIAGQRFPDIARLVLYDGNGPLPFPSASFDVVFAACVFHHIPAAEHLRLFREWARVLKPAGSAFVFEHNPFNPLTVRAVNMCEFDEHAVLLRPGRLTSLLEEAGLRDANCRFRIFFPHALRFLRPVEHYLTWLPLGAQYLVSARNPWNPPSAAPLFNP